MLLMRTLSPFAIVLWIGATAAAVATTEAHTALPVPFAATFDTPTLDPAWTVDVSKGNTVEVADGALVIHAAMNTYAHIERPLGVDYVRASCAIQPAPAITWCTSLFVYWNPGNWCQFGINNRDGGRYYVLEMIDQKSHEYTLGACPFDQWHHVAIEVGGDCIRYLSSEDGSRFKAERIARRPNTFAAAPARLIVGKGHGGPAGYPASDLDNDYATAGEMATSRIKTLRVEPLAWDRLRATPEEQAVWEAEGLDRLGDAEMADGDPTFESVARHFPPMKYPREVVGVKDHPYDIGVAADGALQLNSGCADASAPIAFFEIGEPAYRFGTGATPCAKHLLNGYMPIVIARDRHDGLELEQTIFGHTRGCSPDEPLFAFVRLRVSNPGDAARSVAVRLRAQPAGLKQASESWTLDVPAHGEAALYVKVPFAIAEQAPVAVAATEFDTKLQEAVRHWEDLIAPGTRFEIPEPRVQDAYRAWIAYNFLNVDKRDGVYHICDGAGFYEQVYGYSAALYCLMLDLMGYHEQAEVYIDSLLTFQRPDGLFYVNFGHTDTGTLLHVMSEHYRITGDADWLRRVAPNMIAMCNWIIERRPESMAHTHGRRAVVHGLIRFRPYCDYELAAFDYYADAYLCRGMRETADVFTAIGLSDEAKRIQREYEAYRKDILISMDAATITHDGMRMLPLMPDTHFLLKETGYTANG
ncbi:MAG: hypothetical protein JXA69_13210, partial [Phycisphaerae bacterium]|nr:hypothetical protein [Phycisphaerae bacterium]